MKSVGADAGGEGEERSEGARGRARAGCTGRAKGGSRGPCACGPCSGTVGGPTRGRPRSARSCLGGPRTLMGRTDERNQDRSLSLCSVKRQEGRELTLHVEARSNLCQLDRLVRRLLEHVMSVHGQRRSRHQPLHVLFGKEKPCFTHLKLTKSPSLANVMARLLSSLGTGKRYLRTS